ncbi:NACHT [Porites harrisoni]
MEAFTWCKELWTPKTFNKFSFLVNVLWIAVGIVLFGVFLDMEINESRFDFRCDVNKNAKVDKDFVRQKCFVEYEKLHNKLSVPLYSFVIVNFSLPFIVCVIYSILAKPRVNKLESRNTDVEGQNHQATTTQRKLFIQYCCQLATRFCLRIVFILLLLYEVFYPREFPSNFKCDLMREVNQTAANATGNTKSPSYECINQRAHKKTSWMYAVSGANGILAAFLLIEFFIIFSRAIKGGKQFMDDSQFYTDHLKSNYDPQNSHQEIPLLTVPQQELQDTQGEGNHETLEPLQREHLTKLRTCFKRMKESVLKNTERLRDLSSPLKPNPGEGAPKDLKLDQIYTNLIIHPGRAYYHFPENRREQLKVYPKPDKNLPPKAPGDIVDDLHKNILIVGRPGIGKTLFCTKFMRDWASDRLFDETQNSELRFDVAFLVKFRRLNSTAELNLRELLNESEFSTHMNDVVWNYIRENPSKVLFIFDGIDEFSARKELQGDHSIYEDTVDEIMPLHALYTKIASGKLLNGATVLTTTRPTAVSCIRDLEFSRVVEILGFSSGKVKNYVEKFAGDDKGAGETIWQHISNNLNLFSLCYIPVNCFIICSCLLYMLQNFCSNSIHGLASLPTKLTDIYSFAVKLIFFRHSNRYRNKTDAQDEIFKKFDELAEDVKGDFKKLGTIAFKGIKEGRLTFESDEVTNLEDCGLLHRLPDLKPEAKRPFEKPKAQYCFQHLTIQEFFAAKHVTDNKGEVELREFVSSHITDGAWQVVLQFVAGLLSDREKPLTDIFTNLLPVSTYEDKEDVSWWPRFENAHLALTLCHCLYEIDADDSAVQNKVREIDFNAVVLKYCRLGPVDCTAIVNFLKKHNEILMIDLSGNKIGCLGCKEISEFLESSTSVSDGNCKLSSLNLNHSLVTDEGVKYLAKALKHNNCKLDSLNLADNELTNEGVQCLAEALKDSNCTLSSLNLNHNLVTDEVVDGLAEALKHSNCKLKSLNLAGKELVTDKGVQCLAEALKNSNCKLSSLNLTGNEFTDEGVKYLAEALKDGDSELKTLHLACNKLADEGVKCLAEALKDCKLNSLILWQNNVTDEGVKYLAEALKDSNCKLKSLILASNEFTDEGVKYLAEALKDGDCELKTLDLACNKLADEGVKYLAEALKDCKLNSLILWQNNVTDEGVKYLAEALKDSNCKLKSLILAGNEFTDEGVKYLAEALKDGDCELKTLDLASNKLADEEVKYLAEALKDGDCELKTLDLACNKLADEGVKYLAEALKDSNCKLKSLHLTNNKLTDEGVNYLAEALKDGNCKLHSLDLAFNNVTDKGVKYLAEALKHNNCKLKSLNLTNNKLTHEGVNYLAEALKDGNCQLHSLDLACNELSDERVYLTR